MCYSELCDTFSKKPVPHAYLPIFDQILSLQSGYLFWQSPKHHQTVPIPAWIQLFRAFWKYLSYQIFASHLILVSMRRVFRGVYIYDQTLLVFLSKKRVCWSCDHGVKSLPPGSGSENIILKPRHYRLTGTELVQSTSAACASPRQLQRSVWPSFATVWIVSSSNLHTTSVLDLRSPNNTGHLFLLFFFQFSFFLWIKLGLFLLFPFAFVFFPLITHICFSLFESELCRCWYP